MSKTIRIRISAASAAQALFEGSTLVPAPQQLNQGCLDPECCGLHPGITPSGEPMVGLAIPQGSFGGEGGLSGREINRRLVAAGLVVNPWSRRA
jgi:hypothetical protein